MYKCADEYVFFDTATYELDSASEIAMLEGKPKKAYMYYNRRLEDLTSL